MDIFQLASRQKLRFDTPQGAITTEDLWDLPLTTTSRTKANLDEIAIGLDQQIRTMGEVKSFVRKTTSVNETLKLKLDVVVAVIEVKKTEAEAEEALTQRKQQKQRILELIATKEDEALATKSVDELKQLVGAL